MNIDRIAFTKTFPVGMTWEKVMMEAEVWENEDPKECLEILKKEVEQFHRQSNPQLYPNGKEAVVDAYDGEKFSDRYLADEAGQWAKPHEGLRFTSPKEKVINLQDEREYIKVEKEIATVTSLEDLAKYKEYCGKNPDLMSCYTSKLRDLTEKIKTNI